MPSKSHDWDNVPGFDRETEEYVRLDLDQWLREHKIVEEGKRLGSRNEPSANAHDLDGVESKILAWINRRGRVCRENVSRHLSDLERNLADMENNEELAILEQKVREISNDAEIGLERNVGDGRGELITLEYDVQRGERDFKDFRGRSGLGRLPDYSHRKSALRFVLGFFFVEVVLNATLLMDVNAFGLLGSVGQMGLIGAINVLILGSVMGALLRQLFHVAALWKILSSLAMVPLVAAVVIFNLLVAHFRDSMQAVLDDPTADIFSVGADTFDRFWAGFASLDSFQSALLALLGFLFFCVASWKWLQRDDVYPGYGRRARQRKETQKNYLRRYNRAQRGLRDVFNEYKSRLEDIRHSLVIKRSRWTETCARGNRVVEDYSTNLEQYQHDLTYLLNAYRQANRDARTEPAPPHFDRRENIDTAFLAPPTFDPPDGNSLEGVADRVGEAITKLQETFQRRMREYKTLEDLLRDPSDMTEKRA